MKEDVYNISHKIVFFFLFHIGRIFQLITMSHLSTILFVIILRKNLFALFHLFIAYLLTTHIPPKCPSRQLNESQIIIVRELTI